VSKYNALIQFLESVAAKEGAAGNQYFKNLLNKITQGSNAGKMPHINLSDDLMLKLYKSEEAGGYFTKDGLEIPSVNDVWRLVNKNNQGDNLGTFIAKNELGSNKNKAIMSFSEIYEDHNKGKGIGTKAYGALSKQYGNLVSDKEATTREAFKIYDKIGRELKESDDIYPMFNKDKKVRKIIESTKLPDYLKIFDDE